MIPPVIQRKTPLGRIVDYDIKEAYSSDTDDHALAALQTSHINPDMKIKIFHRVTIYIWVNQERRAACGDKRQLPKPTPATYLPASLSISSVATMYPPSQGLNLDIDALSGICGSISIACWVVVFSPQIIENFRRGSADGLSVVFIVIWLAGDVFNILGAVLQGVLPTMIILALYYTLADIVLLAQYFYYEGFTLRDKVKKRSDASTEAASDVPSSERTPLLSPPNGPSNDHANPPAIADRERRPSHSSFRERLLSVGGEHLSPVTPLITDPAKSGTLSPQRAQKPKPSLLRAALFNLVSILLVCMAGILGWWLSARTSRMSQGGPGYNDGGEQRVEGDTLKFNIAGQVFGYICAALYLGSRVPQLLLNWRRKSTEGISMLFFLFACVGNATYVLSILAYEPVCTDGRGWVRRCRQGEGAKVYGRYIAVNLSWLIGSLGTLFLDGFVFVQYFLYKKEEDEDMESVTETDEEDASAAGTPRLARD
ncbi:putative vacuolar membrane transporter for cationic amino acids [Coniosporium apollinis]|uniref:Vacuolar membrane transporter for cationic amino acids n=1 Tax=Coniosporium apollinis TaxID=61459 RepID=A0ABQ9NQR9_9PEZI|nr:putative vacuolar membrane transporter for cationic amino acids [Coniosporium apollinis]